MWLTALFDPLQPSIHTLSNLLDSPNPLIVSQQKLLIATCRKLVERDSEVSRLLAELASEREKNGSTNSALRETGQQTT